MKSQLPRICGVFYFMKIEIWKDIIVYEGLYQISNLGRVKSLIFKNHRILKGWNNGEGYIKVELKKDNTSKNYLISRLVAFNFIENSFNLPQVNHIDGNKSNNSLNNLEWVSSRENNCHRINRNKTYSKYTGVTLRSGSGINKTRGNKKWVSTITVNGKNINLGYFKTEEEAFLCRLEFEKKNNIKNKYL